MLLVLHQQLYKEYKSLIPPFIIFVIAVYWYIIYQSFDSFENSIEVEFLDENENVFSDKIKYHYFVDFGYEVTIFTIYTF